MNFCAGVVAFALCRMQTSTEVPMSFLEVQWCIDFHQYAWFASANAVINSCAVLR